AAPAAPACSTPTHFESASNDAAARPRRMTRASPVRDSWSALVANLRVLAGAALLAVASPALAVDDEVELAELLPRARVATGVEAFRKGGRDLLVEGTSQRFGVTGPWTARVSAEGRFVRLVGGDLAERDGFDGQETWHSDATGMAVGEALAQRE